MDNILIDHLFLSLSALMQLDDDGYRQIFEEDIKSGYFHSGYRDAINSLLCQESFDWKYFFKEQNFYQYDDPKTGEELLLGFKVLTNEWFFQRKPKEKEGFAKWGSGEI